MKEYKQIYRCRLCGEIFQNGACTGNKELADDTTFQLAVFGKAKDCMAGGLLDTHTCKNGMRAIGDFVGFEEIET